MKIVLGSQSPRRRELMQAYTGADRIQVLPPLSDEELSFDDLSTTADIESRLEDVVRQKLEDVKAQTDGSCCVLCADTIVVVGQGAERRVLGKPPADSWQDAVRHWFQTYYSGQTHDVWTMFQLATQDNVHSRIVKTAVTMPEIDDALINWYLSTEEPLGKAGGYGIQGQASIFIERMEGSLTNVIGLPMLEVAEALRQLGVFAPKRPGG